MKKNAICKRCGNEDIQADADFCKICGLDLREALITNKPRVVLPRTKEEILRQIRGAQIKIKEDMELGRLKDLEIHQEALKELQAALKSFEARGELNE